MGTILSLILKRIGLGIVSLIAVSMIIFFAVELLPGDLAEAILGQNATPETLEAMRRDLGLDRVATTRYFEWVWGVLQGDLGESLASGRRCGRIDRNAFWRDDFLGHICSIDLSSSGTCTWHGQQPCSAIRGLIARPTQAHCSQSPFRSFLLVIC